MLFGNEAHFTLVSLSALNPWYTNYVIDLRSQRWFEFTFVNWTFKVQGTKKIQMDEK